MNVKFVKILSTAALALTLTAQYLAPAQAGEVQDRLNNQQTRINNGVRDGQLTPRERREDQRRLNHIRELRNRDLRRHNGHLTKAEYYRLNHRLDGESNQIYNTRH